MTKCILSGLLGFILGVGVTMGGGYMFYAGTRPLALASDQKARSEGMRKVKILVEALRAYDENPYSFKNAAFAPRTLQELVDAGYLSKKAYDDATSGLRVDYLGSPDRGYGRDGVVVVAHGPDFAVYGSKSGTIGVLDIK